ncbi:MAG: tetratricopeptide repeat protein, partial [Planctomycetota bacterium]
MTLRVIAVAEDEDTTESNDPKPSGDLLSTGLMLSAALIAIAGFAMLFSRWFGGGVPDKFRTLQLARAQYINDEPVVAGKLAEKVELSAESEEEAELIAERDFLVGVGLVQQAAREGNSREKRRLLYDAIPILESSAKLGFPPGRFAEGHRNLGESYYRLGKFDQAIASLQQAIEIDSLLRRQLLPLLADSQLHANGERSPDALSTIDLHLSDPALQPESRRQSQLIRVQALLKLNRFAEAERAIQAAQAMVPKETIGGANSNQRMAYLEQIKLYTGELAVRTAQQRYGPEPADAFEDRTNAVEELAPTLRLLGDLEREAIPRVAYRARLLSADAYRCQGRIGLALAELTTVRQQRPFGGEGAAAYLIEMELLAQQGRGKDALLTVRNMIREMGDERGYDASMIPFAEFKRRTLDAIAELRQNREFESTIDIARALPPVFETVESLIQEGTGFQQWAEDTIRQGTNLGGETSRSAFKLGRERFRAAGDAFAKAAELEFTSKDYVPTLWLAIQAYQEGRHFSRSIELLESYLRYEDRSLRPRGLVAYGRALLADGMPEEAIKSLTECITQFDRDPLRYDARLLSAKANAELGQVDEAKRLLLENLEDGDLAPNSPTWRESQFTIGEITFQNAFQSYLQAQKLADPERLAALRANQPNFEDATRYLNVAVERYSTFRRADLARYTLARAHVLASKFPALEAKSPDVLDSAARSQQAKADTLLNQALEEFVSLKSDLLRREEELRLSSRDESMLRNCFMDEADTLREMREFQKAAEAYRGVTQRYMNEPTALEAIMGHVTCARELNDDDSADRLIRQAVSVLDRIP